MGSRREIAAFWDRSMSDGTFAALLALIPQDSAIRVAGVATEFDLDTGDFTYFIAVETPSDRSTLPPGCRDTLVPAATWGVSDARGAVTQSIPALMPRIFNEWFPSSSWEHADGPVLEIYPDGDTQSDDYRCEVWVPLQKSAQ